jgi:type IV pilus assembly protein PilF
MPPDKSMRQITLVLWMAVALAGAGCVQTSSVQRQSTDTAPRTTAEPGDADKRAAVRLELAGGYFSRGQFDTALEEVRQAIEAKPDLGAAYNMRGLIYAAMGDDRLAAESFDRALAINPRDADAMHNRGWFECQRGRYEVADRLFEQALAVPQYREAPRTLAAQGVCLARAGQTTSAEQKLLRSYELDPSNPGTAFNLAEVLYRLGQYERARFYVRRVNEGEDTSNAQTLWLAVRIEHRAGNRNGVENFGRQLRARFPQSREALAFERGRFDE